MSDPLPSPSPPPVSCPDSHMPSSPVIEGARGMHASESSYSESENKDPKWKYKLSCPVILPFTDSSPVGPTIQIPERPKEIFQLFFTEELMPMIVQQTNKYTQEVSPSGKVWVEVTAEELYAFLGFNFLMGLNPKPSLGDYWRKKPNLSIQSHMRQNHKRQGL